MRRDDAERGAGDPGPEEHDVETDGGQQRWDQEDRRDHAAPREVRPGEHAAGGPAEQQCEAGDEGRHREALAE